MFATDGWRMFIEEMRLNQQAIFPQLMGTPSTQEDLYFLKGRDDVYKSVLGLQNLMENVKKNMEEPELNNE
jgi:hypothetical protein